MFEFLSVKKAHQLAPELSCRSLERRCKREGVPMARDPGTGRLGYNVPLSFLPPRASLGPTSTVPLFTHDPSINSEIYSNAPVYNKAKVMKYLPIIQAWCDVRGTLTKREFIGEYNSKHPGLTISIRSLERAIANKENSGAAGLLGQYGKNKGRFSSNRFEDAYQIYKSRRLIQGGPSKKTAWLEALGAWKIANADGEISSFPFASSFENRLINEIGPDRLFYARRGREAWNRRYGYSIQRDLSNVPVGACYVGDQAVWDILVLWPDGTIGRPYFTGWFDLRSQKCVGFLNHRENPSSHEVMLSLGYALRDFGLCDHIMIDNGLTYKNKNLAGPRPHTKAVLDEAKTTAIVSALGITPHFCIVRNAQAKINERRHLIQKEVGSKNFPCYTGGNVREKPDTLNQHRKEGRALPWEEAKEYLDRIIVNVANKLPSQGALGGKCPDEAWEKGISETQRRGVSPPALKLFFTPFGDVRTIGRNGIVEGGYRWYSDALLEYSGEKIYMRRDPQAFQTAYVFRASDDEYLCMAELTAKVPGLVSGDIEKAALKEAMRQKRRVESVTKAYIKCQEVPTADAIAMLERGVEAVNKARGYVPSSEPSKLLPMPETKMDQVIRKKKKLDAIGAVDLTGFAPPPLPPDKIPIFDLYEQWKRDSWLAMSAQNRSTWIDERGELPSDYTGPRESISVAG